ncbi:MAG: PD-(D/E)XK nuclease family protein, partial [Emcibacteraceae bacterium]|nr:PD-(D/E)XK nuclease family protein [Emcibacteraceae bacterium]
IMIHEILEDFMSRFKDTLPSNAEDELIEIGRNYFDKAIDRPTVRAFWWPRFKQIAKWFIETESIRRKDTRTVLTETKGEINLNLAGGTFKLSATADRIDQLDDGSLSIIDYKTGQPPTLRQLKAGFAPQLPLEAAIAAKGGFSLLPNSMVSELSYWQLSGGEPAGKITFFNEAKKVDIPDQITKAYDGLAKLVTTFDLLETPYLNKPRPEAVGYGEYDHLARTKEWGDG